MPNPRYELEIGQRVKYFNDFDDTWNDGYVEGETKHDRSTPETPMCWYTIRFNDGSNGIFSNCNSFLMCYTVDEVDFLSRVLPSIDFDDLYWS
jgi:hypothetical protein